MTAMISGAAAFPFSVDATRGRALPGGRQLAPVADLAAITELDVFPVSEDSGDRPALSGREIEVMLAWLAADSKEEAATRLFISASTVSTHVSRIRAKYAAAGRPAPTKAHLLARALQDGYTSLSEW